MFKQTQIETNSLNVNYKELLSDILTKDELKELDIGSNLGGLQKKAFELFKEGKSLLMLGVAGSGKSVCIKTMQEYNNNIINDNIHKNMVLTSTTGISSYHILGQTIHSFMGIGTGERSIDFLLNKVMRNDKIVERIKSTDILVIDEISMLSAILFEKIDLICKHVRKSKKFMGGMQIILTGDLLQNMPIFNQSYEIGKLEGEQDKRLIIDSKIFTKEFNKKNNNIIVLKENFRQKSDLLFMQILSRIRIGEHLKEDIELLNKKCVEFENHSFEKIPVHLVTTNKKAQYINEKNLDNLKGKNIIFNSKFQKESSDLQLAEILENELKTQFRQRGIDNITLKSGARVMLIKNLDTANGLVNGAIGTVEKINKKTVDVIFDNGIKKLIEYSEWTLEINNTIIKAKQIPLILAYALTISKSQSLTLEEAIMDLSDCFTEHQVYVALSRVKSLNGLYLKSFDEKKIWINLKMKTYLKNIEE